MPQFITMNLIISSGDISDIDGFVALAEYAKTGADCLFVMNYPSYLGDIEEDAEETELGLGLGYRFGVNAFLKSIGPEFHEFHSFFHKRYSDTKLTTKEKVREMTTQIALRICLKVWDEMKTKHGNGGRFWFCIGGVNSIGPFSAKAVKKEIVLYQRFVPDDARIIDTDEGLIFSLAEFPTTNIHTFNTHRYSNVFMDFNGSMSFIVQDVWIQEIKKSPNIRAAFVMGGVQSDAVPQTMKVPNIINRLTLSTMNQLYHPQGTSLFFELLKDKCPIYVVTNNNVEDIGDISNIMPYLETHDVASDTIQKLANIYYNMSPPPPKKLFDLYTAISLTKFMLRPKLFSGPGTFFYDETYGCSLVSQGHNKSWSEALDRYKTYLHQKKDRTGKEVDWTPEVSVLDTLEPNSVNCEILNVRRDKNGILRPFPVPLPIPTSTTELQWSTLLRLASVLDAVVSSPM